MLTEAEIRAIENDLTDRVRVLLCADWREWQRKVEMLRGELLWYKYLCAPLGSSTGSLTDKDAQIAQLTSRNAELVKSLDTFMFDNSEFEVKVNRLTAELLESSKAVTKWSQECNRLHNANKALTAEMKDIRNELKLVWTLAKQVCDEITYKALDDSVEAALQAAEKETVIDLDDLPHFCGTCKRKLQHNGPGRYQCNHCESGKGKSHGH